ncbi:MAG: arsenic metallochaperone ArsD family protein [Erysipelothrix sp.]|nr:arsenic metallochaperone ArsD family protein [Erysipelothrix sp.]
MNIKIYEERESLESMILGINQDPKRSMFNEMLKELKDVTIERINDVEGVIPRFVVDGTIHELGHYPNVSELSTMLGIDESTFSSINFESNILQEANQTRLGACCGVGEDIYLDPNED